jgi:hypothetical protein
MLHNIFQEYFIIFVSLIIATEALRILRQNVAENIFYLIIHELDFLFTEFYFIFYIFLPPV